MSDSRATRNADSLNNAAGEFNPHAPRSDPMTTHGHKPGVQASPNDHAPEFSAKTAPPGTAPKQDTYTPQPGENDSIPGQADNASAVNRTGALDMPGSTSADVHTGLGHPGSGQTSTELKHGGQHTASRDGAGLEGVGSGPRGVDREFAKLGEERSFGEHGPAAARENNASLPGAEEVPNVGAEQVASERR
ncbi:uncharacterized protein HMPREF1541_01183 [Cyphellophora europaea CBS 101466]|uniref:Uncharacterized protein n=1 Tax=Cyphellophora europaea (strain CBS 101466) TaxID=1220924 RepID=W2SG68_CYPE1|nr:uncharacterized protein HMPREF1541_01183 [Cyphellophora europaea CBS 101466]ETN46993.1 hypothetical protein HMPREF1541_01183 [Cyphellophora europaea CBS 101466]